MAWSEPVEGKVLKVYRGKLLKKLLPFFFLPVVYGTIGNLFVRVVIFGVLSIVLIITRKEFEDPLNERLEKTYCILSIIILFASAIGWVVGILASVFSVFFVFLDRPLLKKNESAVLDYSSLPLENYRFSTFYVYDEKLNLVDVVKTYTSTFEVRSLGNRRFDIDFFFVLVKSGKTSLALV